MQLVCLSVSHQNTPVSLRECLSLSGEAIEEGFHKYPVRTHSAEMISEMVILSTCNRLEIYALVLEEKAAEPLLASSPPILAYLADVFHIPAVETGPRFRTYSGIQAVDHLFRVAAGLDSIAVGETQILGQVSRALEIALRQGSARHVLSSLFRAAVHAGKRVRTDTEIGRHPTSIAALGVEIAESVLGPLASRRVLVVGAGKMGRNTLETLREHGASHWTLTNRTYPKAVDLARQHGGSALPFENLAHGVMEAEVVFTTTSGEVPIIGPELVAGAMQNRPHIPLLLVDLAVPRNVDLRVRNLANVRLFDMDDFQAYVKNETGHHSPAISQANAIVAEEVAEYEKLLRVIPFIGELHRKVEQIRQREVDRTLRQLHSSDTHLNEQIEVFSRALVRKILHEPTMHLRTEANRETLNDYVDTLARLFDLTEKDSDYILQKDEKWVTNPFE